MPSSMLWRALLAVVLLSLVAVNHAKPSHRTLSGSAGSQIDVEDLGAFNEPWAMTFLPEGQLLVTQRAGQLWLVNLPQGHRQQVKGVPLVSYGGQGGLGDVIIHPQFNRNHWIYLSYAEQDQQGRRGAVVIRAQLKGIHSSPQLVQSQVIWRQTPKVVGSGHYSYRLAFSPAGQLFITSGDRQQQTPAQDWQSNLGKIIRLNADGTGLADNPFQNKGELAKSFWSLGHRNMLGIAFDRQGRLWSHEMGPRHGDELNLIQRGDNYGWPLVSWGDHYSGQAIADHDTRPAFHPPATYWVPTIAPSGLVIYSGALFPQWQGNALIGGLRSKALIRVAITGDFAQEVERFAMGKRIREVEQGPQGAIYLLEDRRGGRLLRLTPH